jgi:hypothetical protein
LTYGRNLGNSHNRNKSREPLHSSLLWTNNQRSTKGNLKGGARNRKKNWRGKREEKSFDIRDEFEHCLYSLRMTVGRVLGCGEQGGKTGTWRPESLATAESSDDCSSGKLRGAWSRNYAEKIRDSNRCVPWTSSRASALTANIPSPSAMIDDGIQTAPDSVHFSSKDCARLCRSVRACFYVQEGAELSERKVRFTIVFGPDNII